MLHEMKLATKISLVIIGIIWVITTLLPDYTLVFNS